MKKVDIAIPVYYGNIPYIEDSIKKQSEFYKKNIKDYDWCIVLSINGPDKGIVKFSNEMIKKYKTVKYTYTPVAGKGAGIKKGWNDSKADILADRIKIHLKDDQWFFDTELMFFATKNKFRIKEIPIVWTDSGFVSGVKIYRTMANFIFKIIEIRIRSFFN